MGKLIASAGVAALLVGSMAVAQQQGRLPAECRQEIMALCQSSMGGGMRACVRSILPTLSDACRQAIGERGASAPPAPGTRELARGGRYDGVGREFGVPRPATGFSADLNELLRLSTRN